jgi:hypothetical protein
MKGKTVDLTGMRFGRLTVIGKTRSSSGRVAWNCKCDCGNETTPLTTSLLKGHSQSCGCLHSDMLGDMFRKHGQYRTRLYRIWSNMIQRCNNPKNDNYHLYGAKGVSVCDEWKDFATFSKWAMDSGYADNLSIDRIETGKSYYPSNCRWATPQEQTDNRECTRYVSFNGKTQTLKRWSEETGIAYKNLLWRIDRGWPAEKALTKK